MFNLMPALADVGGLVSESLFPTCSGAAVGGREGAVNMIGGSIRSSQSRPVPKRPLSEADEEIPIEEEEREVIDLGNIISSRRRNKRRRFRSMAAGNNNSDRITTESTGSTNGNTSSLVLVSGLPAGCTVLEIKSRFEMYGSISRIRIEDGGSALITYRSLGSAQAAVSASLEPDIGILFQSKRVYVYLISEPRVAMGFSLSKLLKPEIPLSKHGRSNKKLSGSSSINPSTPSIMPFEGRQMIAYDDLF